MAEKLQQIAKAEIAKLPKENQEAINALDWGKICENIGARYALEEVGTNDLQTEVLLILCGIQDARFFPSYIENNVGLTSQEAKEVSEEIFQKIFRPIDNTIGEKLRDTLKTEAGWHQNVNFIISGGDYSALRKSSQEPNTKQ